MENNNTEKRNGKIRALISKYGTYALVLLCITGVAVASVVLLPRDKSDKNPETALGSNNTGLNQKVPDPTSAPVSQSKDQSLNDVLDPITGKVQGDGGPRTPTPDFTQAPEPSETPKTKLLTTPVDGEIIWAFAIDELIYSATLDQWTTHAGVDIACVQGEKIRAVADGVVEKVYTDDAFGITVAVRHGNKHLSVYSNLADSDELIKEGAKVKANDVIGVCGNTAVFECADKSHLHFEYHVDGKPVDPCEYVLIKKG